MAQTIYRVHAYLMALFALAALGACAGSDSIVPPPVRVAALQQPMDIEPVATGAIFRSNMTVTSLFSDRRKPTKIGDALKIDISETLSATSEQTSNTSKETKLTQKGPGSESSSLGGILKGIMNVDATASGSDTLKGTGTAGNNSKFSGRLAAAVINVMPNGYLLVAGEKSIVLNNGISTLRFSGVVNPYDITAGNVVASGDVVDAKLELVGKGDVQDATSRNWMQRILAKSLSFW
jgi:flagellar L-ring protein precursor FlgH